MLAQSFPEVRLKIENPSVKKNGIVSFLKLSLAVVLLLALITITPVSGASPESGVLPETPPGYFFENQSDEMEGRSLKEHSSSPLVQPAVRETKVRSGQKKHSAHEREYRSSADLRGDVFFAESPVVTGLHLPDGVFGQVALYPEPSSSGPKCREVYSVFTLSAEHSLEGREAVICYTLPLEVIADRGSDPSEVSLYFFENAVWRKLPTEYYMDSHSAFFESVTTSLGIFAVVSEECSPEIESVGLRSPHLESAPVSLDVSPAVFLTQPLTYSASAE